MSRATLKDKFRDRSAPNSFFEVIKTSSVVLSMIIEHQREEESTAAESTWNQAGENRRCQVRK